MKTCKKLLAVLLSVLLLVGVVIMPTSAESTTTSTVATAETTVSKYISLLDLSAVAVGVKATEVPDGIPNIQGMVNADAKNITNGFSGNQEIIENEDGSRSWKLHFDTPMTGGGYLNSYNGNMFAMKFLIPTKYVTYITAINCDITNGVDAADRLYLQFGISDGTTFSAFAAKGQSDSITYGNATKDVAVKYDKNITDLYKQESSTLASEHKNLTEMWTLGSEFTYVYAIMAVRGNAGTEGGFALINDIGITISGTQAELNAIPETTTYNLLDLSDCELGALTDYPAGISEFKAVNSKGVETYGAYKGTKEVVKKADGSKALKLDLTTATFTRSAEAGTADSYRLFQGGYHTGNVYSIKLKVPSNHIHLIDNITFKYDNQTTAEVVYSFGVSYGDTFSKNGTNRNNLTASDTTGVITTERVPADLTAIGVSYAVGTYNSGTYSKWGTDEFDSLYLMISASASEGYITIDEISYTITASQAEYDQYKGFITGYEAPGETETELAASGTRVKNVYTGSDGFATQRWSVLQKNTNLADATGLNFWVINPTEKTTTYKIALKGADGSSYVISDSYKIAAGASKLIKIDFASVYEDTNPSSPGSYSKGDLVTLAPEQIADLTTLTLMCRQALLNIYVDDIKLVFETSKDAAAVDLTGATGASEVTEDGKIKFYSSAEGSDLTARIEVPTGFFTSADKMTLNFDADVAAKYSATVVGTNDNGATAHWKWGYKDWTADPLTAGAVGYAYSLNFAGHKDSFTRQTIHEGIGEGRGDCKACTPSAQEGWNGSSGHANNPPTPAEKTKITTILIRVFENVGEDTQAITLNSITVSYAGNTITSTVSTDDASLEIETGDVVLDKAKVFTGDTAGFTVEAADMYYPSAVEVVDNYGNAVPVTLTASTTSGDYYTFTMPLANVTITAAFESLAGTIMHDTNYVDGDDVQIDFEIPVRAGKVYNVTDDGFQTLDSYGIIVTSEEALAKYGKTVDDLTVDFVKEIKESGHHLGNYIYLLEGADAIKNESASLIDFSVKFTDITIRARRAPFTMVTYANFTDEGANTATEINGNSIDGMVYGDYFQSEFYAYNGINYSRVCNDVPALAETNAVFELATWVDIREHGFDHVRLPVKIASSVDENGIVSEESFQKLDKIIENALYAGVSLVVDLHGYKEICTDYGSVKDEFIGVWDQFAERYAHLPLSVVFELLNEPSTDNYTYSEVGFDEEGNAYDIIYNPDPMDDTELMDLQETLISNIRGVKGNEDRKLVIGTHVNMVSKIDTISKSILATENLIFDVHYYAPMKFTHSGATWKTNSDGSLMYPAGETDYSTDSMDSALSAMSEFRTNYPNIDVWVGEWGAYAPEATAKLNYIADFTAYADSYEIGRCMWEYGTSWGPYSGSTWRADILEAMGLS